MPAARGCARGGADKRAINRKKGRAAHAPSNPLATLSVAVRNTLRAATGATLQPPGCMRAFILAAIDSIRAICCASALRTTAFWAGVNVA